ncbi:MAG: sulfotransferase [Blastocatellia bacterium]|nr:sulfotransferase [Blastocatellia bacterium]
MRMTLRCVERDLLSWRSARYLGWRNLLHYRSLARFDRPWGWKDPRNVLTLPLWAELFPGAKIIYIVRHGVDVAQSLVVREQQYLNWQRVRFRERFHRPSLRTHLERVGFRGSTRCLTLAGAFALWASYMAHAAWALAHVSNERMIIRYEDFVREPLSFLGTLADFCGLPNVRRWEIEEASREVEARRAYAFISDPALVAFFRRVRTNAWMEHYGYSEAVLPSRILV